MADVVVLGVFVADASYRARRLPRMGETLIGETFALGPGGKGSNQAVACGRLGAEVAFLTRLGRDTFAEMARETWRKAGVTPAVIASETGTGSAFIFIDAETGDNAIIISPGAAAELCPADIDRSADLIGSAKVALTQLEQPITAAERFLAIAREANVTTILNPAPAADLPDGLLALCDWVTPNESEAEALTGRAVGTEAETRRAAEDLLAAGARGVVVTLGPRGALLHDGDQVEIVPALSAGTVIETTGAGDAFNAGFATALARGQAPAAAVRHACEVAAISVTRAGAARSMPTAEEVKAVFGDRGEPEE